MSTKVSIELTTITCLNTSERGHDEVYIKYTVDGGREDRFPDKGSHSMSPDSSDNTWTVNLPISFSDSAIIALYDEDTLGDEFLGSHTYYPTDTQPETATVSNTNGAKYNLSTISGQ
jgi:hypothetical protein